ncbi:unnamed protein product [Diplocarpon coronariae]|uniref:Uncharacterized protein n=1 Tax=Diplocarpon coronariae TaxID=2795749 RepID=A0A218Z880_9HELO|nr:hypothetical protein B2J93_4836 [Marssonina coronariae]
MATLWNFIIAIFCYLNGSFTKTFIVRVVPGDFGDNFTMCLAHVVDAFRCKCRSELFCRATFLWYVVSELAPYKTTRGHSRLPVKVRAFVEVLNIRNMSSSASAKPNLAMKVFWRIVGAEEAAALLDSDSVEEMQLPSGGTLEIERDLRESALWLPPSARKFKDWDVGLLARYQPKP